MTNRLSPGCSGSGRSSPGLATLASWMLPMALLWPDAAPAQKGGAAASVPDPVPAIFHGADLPLGEKLIRENRCTECHVRNVGGDGMSIYNPRGRISTPGALRGMVEYCSSQLNLGFFPEEVTSVAAVLQRDHYRFKAEAVADKR